MSASTSLAAIVRKIDDGTGLRSDRIGSGPGFDTGQFPTGCIVTEQSAVPDHEIASRLTGNTRYRQQNAVGIVDEYCLFEGSTDRATLRTRIVLPQGIESNMPSLKIVGTFALSAVGLLGMINASAADSYKFTLHNRSQYPISGFETYEDGKWSRWTKFSADPGDEVTMNWTSDSGECTVPFRIIYRDVETEQYRLDWCKISDVYVNDDSVTAN